ncbi:type IV pilus assembly protein PilM [Anaerohalosphaera lusitana]|uniref:Type IV pilus assembly protein PilM n=1 Tax=Anaerohalosphaera lusitana TaxID=1936003 RepID=A0A1U9NP61_9BACT|nr:pilus assembly protein PilM [Anaerohalosphaera lusitana]AQT69587.1 type IV pilus assembly protein PilM [Anaerohalosphaera lusitana]
MFRKKQSIGLDTNTSGTTLVLMRRRKNGYKLKALAQADHSESFVDSFDPLDHIRKCFIQTRSKPRRSQRVACGLNGTEVTVNRFDFPAMSEQELEYAIHYEAGEVCPFNIDRCVVDFCLAEDQKNKKPLEKRERLRGITVVAKKQAIEEKISTLKRLGLNCRLVDVNGLALLNCIDELEYKGEGRAYAAVSLNERSTTVAVKLADGTCITRELQGGIEMICRNISQAYQMERSHVRQRFDHASPLDQQFQEMLLTGSREVLAQIDETLKFSTSQGTNKQMAIVYLCGPRGITDAFGIPLNNMLPYEVEIWNPMDRLFISKRVSRTGIAGKLRGSAAIALGLAMRLA